MNKNRPHDYGKILDIADKVDELLELKCKTGAECLKDDYNNCRVYRVFGHGLNANKIHYEIHFKVSEDRFLKDVDIEAVSTHAKNYLDQETIYLIKKEIGFS